jgi:mono/diheme cytochrome c family protein
MIVLMLSALLLTACSFSLAADVTPPPDYVSPTPMPTLGALFPVSMPNTQDGAAIFAQNCSPCHGATGLGDGPQSMQLPVTVPGIGLPEVARSASPAAWFKIVTQGNLDRFMPPFAGALTDQQRWDVISYALTLHSTAAQVARGKSLVDANCASCSRQFADFARMAALSENDLVSMIRTGAGDVPAFAKDFSDEDALAAAAYLRTLSFEAAAHVASASTPAVAVGTPQAVPAEGTAAAVPSGSTPSAATGRITGRIEFPSPGAAAPMTVTLHGFDHAADQTTGPQEVLTLSTSAGSDGSYAFENVAMPVNRIFLAEVIYSGIQYRSDFQAAAANSTQLALPTLKLYDATTDISLLSLDQLHITTDFATAGTVQVFEVYAFSNSSNKSVVISTDGTTIPFIKLPTGAQNQGIEQGQNTAPFVPSDKGVAVVPSDKPYSIIAFFNLPYDKMAQIDQPLAIDTPSLLLLVPDGIAVAGKQLTSRGLQPIQSTNYQEFAASGLKAGDTLSFSISGRPRTSSATGLDAHQGILIGGAILGVGLIAAGLYLYIRERRRLKLAPVDADFETADEVMDAILALDDLHRAGRISDDVYKLRRAELKETLRQIA